MVWSESFPFWWLFPFLMILFCLFLCFFRRSRGMAGCCMGWSGSHDVQRDRWKEDRDDKGHTPVTSVRAEEDARVERLQSTVATLERRLRSLEQAESPDEVEGNRSLPQSDNDLDAR